MYLPGTVQERIRDLYTKNGLTQKELADLIGIAPSQLSRIGSGRTQHISSDILIKLAKALKVSTDYILGLTTVPTPKSYDISELGLSEGAVKNLLALKKSMPVLNLILAHQSFPALINQIKSYFYDEMAKGIIGRNDLLDIATASLDNLRKEQPEKNADIREGMRFINSQKFGKHEIDMEKIKNAFLSILRDIKKDIDENASQEASATADFMKKVREECLQMSPDTASPEDAVNVVLEAFEGLAPLDEADKDAFRKLAINIIGSFGSKAIADEAVIKDRGRDE